MLRNPVGYRFTNRKQNPPLFQQQKTSFKDKGEAFHPDKQCIWREKDLRASLGESPWELVLRNIKIKTVT